MKTTGLSDLKKELQELSAKQLADLCLALAKYKKDNKESLAYLLFESHNKNDFANAVKEEVDQHFFILKSQSNLYLTKKSLRKILRIINKFCKYINDNALSAELHIYFCDKLKISGIPFNKSRLITNMYMQELKKINSLIATLHEDLKSDFSKDIERIEI